jgi:hypothetical protein
MGMSACGEASGFMGGEGEESDEVALPEAAKGCGEVKECGVGPAERRTSTRRSPLPFVIKEVRQHGNAQLLVRWRKCDVIRLHPPGQGPLVLHPCPPYRTCKEA